MLALIWHLSSFANDLLQRYAPTNRLIWFLRRRENLRYGVLAMLFSVPYLLIARGALALIGVGAPEWLYLVFILCIWNAIKFLVWGPISLLFLTKARFREAERFNASPTRQPSQDQRTG
ncbi:sulfate permease [Leucobacter sp. cx-328]|uniref:Sulfate permease n=1 Tax=Gulosibacter macacae TaxID=2488791 RepID=A0A3P3VSY2_9MICO|nr:MULTISPECIES: sulfate permease [Microbacteriaceae]MBC9943185.1 sulfate permease [Leucobacter sp. cx-328]MBL5974497.1 sulfate permease [Candidatus Leucobacter sulfamidivorax]RRJ85564.1 sulfate permease [Gulosibacter macacae]